MNILDIPFRSLNRPNLSPKEINVILQSLKNLQSLYTGRRAISGMHGAVNRPSEDEESYITVNFDEDYDPYSIFAVAMTSSTPFFYPLYAVQEVLKNPNRDSINRNQDTIYCTNGGSVAKNGANLSCHIIGYHRPHRIKYSGTAPAIGNKCYPVPAQKYVTVNENGPFLVISPPNTNDATVWIVRHERVMDIYGTADADITYGSDGTISVWRDLTDSGDSATVSFKFLGETGDVIASGTKLHAIWKDDLNNGVGGWLVDRVNCPAAE